MILRELFLPADSSLPKLLCKPLPLKWYRLKSYYKGRTFFVTLTFSSPHDPMDCEYVAEVSVWRGDMPIVSLGVAHT